MWSVVHDLCGRRVVSDVYCKTRLTGHDFTQYRVMLTGPHPDIYVGDTIGSKSALSLSWSAFGNPDKMRNASGFGTRRAAIEYMLRAQGYFWSDETNPVNREIELVLFEHRIMNPGNDVRGCTCDPMSKVVKVKTVEEHTAHLRKVVIARGR